MYTTLFPKNLVCNNVISTKLEIFDIGHNFNYELSVQTTFYLRYYNVYMFIPR